MAQKVRFPYRCPLQRTPLFKINTSYVCPKPVFLVNLSSFEQQKWLKKGVFCTASSFVAAAICASSDDCELLASCGKRHSFFEFPYGYPEPVLVKWSFLV